MIQRIDAIFENGVFRPVTPVNIANGEFVSLNVETPSIPEDDMSDIGDLLDSEYMGSCQRQPGVAPSLEDVQKLLSAFKGSLADRISEERDER